MAPITAVVVNPETPKEGEKMKTELAGPPPRSGGDTTNPSRPDGFGWIDVLIHGVPYMHGGAIGVIEGLARKGKFETWRTLNDYVKAGILATVGGVAEFTEEWADDPALARSMCKLSGAATSHGVAYAVAASIGGQSGELVSEKALKAGWKFDPQTGKELGAGHLLEQFTTQDAKDAERAVNEIISRREEINQMEPVAGIPFGSSEWAPVSLS